MRQAAATWSSLRNAFLMPSRLDIPRAQLVLGPVTLPRAPPQALIEIKAGMLSLDGGRTGRNPATLRL